MKYIYDLHRTMLQQRLILVYEGEFTQEITKSVLAMAERNMESMGENPRVQRKVFNVMMECLQNISRHAEKFDEETYGKNNAIFMIGKSDEAYIITSGNALLREDIPKITEKLDFVNSLDKAGLKQYYKEAIKKSKISDKGGAGLGFIDMAKKSGHKLRYDFEIINEHLAFFSLKATISA